jgi:septal ring factor EnvC (AmiA/AmiB activator)
MLSYLVPAAALGSGLFSGVLVHYVKERSQRRLRDAARSSSIVREEILDNAKLRDELWKEIGRQDGKIERLQEELDRARREHIDLIAAHERLKLEHEHLQLDHTELQGSYDRLKAELDAFRAERG